MRWTVRLRDPDLNLLDEVKFSTLTLVKNYNAPSTLSITGQLNDLRPLLQPSYGVLVSNDDGRQFSGLVTSITRNGDGDGTVLCTGDLVHLWWRVCYPNAGGSPNLAWDSQIASQDSVTGTLEDRILSFVRRNLGASAWYSAITGTDPGESTTFTQYKVIVPDDRSQYVKAVGIEEVSGNIYMTQTADGKDLYVRRLDSNGVQISFMKLTKGGIGDRIVMVRAGGKVKKVQMVLPYGKASQVDFPRFRGRDQPGTWVKLDWLGGGKEYKPAAALAYKAGNPPRSGLPYKKYFRGEASYDGYIFRLYGSPYTNLGPVGDPVPAYVEVIRKNKILRTVPAGQLGRDAANNPYDGRLVPAGLTVTKVAGQPVLLVGITTGTITGGAKDVNNKDAGLIAHRLYSLPLKPAARAAADRRLPGLRLPTSLARGRTGTTVAKFDILGPLTAKLAESANLAMDLVQDYDGLTPYLKFSLTDTPDLSGTIRIGSPDSGSPVSLGDDWTYTVTLPTMTTGLTAAGGLGSDRIMRDATDEIAEDVWNVRVEGFIDQKDKTDLSDIDDEIDKQLLDGSSPAQLTVPLGRSYLRWGIDVPMGAKLSAVLDGQAVVERLRQITWNVTNNANEPTTTITAVLGSPDAALKSPTQKALAQMLKRVQKLERK